MKDLSEFSFQWEHKKWTFRMACFLLHCPAWRINNNGSFVPCSTLVPTCMTCVLFSWGCHNKLSQTWWLKTTERNVFSHSLETRSLKSGCQQGCTPSEGCRGERFLPLPASGALRWLDLLKAASLQSLPVFTWASSLSLCLFFCYKDICHCI